MKWTVSDCSSVVILARHQDAIYKDAPYSHQYKQRCHNRRWGGDLFDPRTSVDKPLYPPVFRGIHVWIMRKTKNDNVSINVRFLPFEAAGSNDVAYGLPRYSQLKVFVWGVFGCLLLQGLLAERRLCR